MINDHIQNTLMNEIRKRIPKSSVLVSKLVELLFIEKEAVYRRLRGEVPFTFKEIAHISKELGISLDAILGIELDKSRPFQIKLPDFAYPQENDFAMLAAHLEFLRSIGNMTHSEMGNVSNIIPQDIFTGFESLLKFMIFNWNYHYDLKRVKTFHELEPSTRLMNAFMENFLETKKIKNTYYVVDNQLILNFVNHVKYFQTLRLIESADVLKIKKDLFDFLDYIEDMAINGYFRETGNSVSLYISDINITSNYCYIETDTVKFSLIKTFLLTSVTSLDEDTFEKMKNWVHSFIKISTLISATGEKQRILFLGNQRKIVSEL
jgi:hypothetical protein